MALDVYLFAVVQHNPSAANLSPGYRETQNSIVKRPERASGSRRRQ
jgi:hypothetical protein